AQAHGLPGAAVPTEIARVRDVDWVPLTLALLLGALALVAIGHALLTTVRRRRRDLAMLKLLGFTRFQTSNAVLWQATALAGIGLVFGIPLGVVIGRYTWRAVADGLGVSLAASITIPWIALAAAIPAMLIVVNMVALLPARRAGRLHITGALHAQ